jgi:TonB family protein
MRKSLPIIIVLYLITTAPTYSVPTRQSVSDVRSRPNISESPDGFNAQFSAIVGAYQSGDKTLGEQLIEQFRLPHPEAWLTEHIGAEQSTALAERYDKLFVSFVAELEPNILDAIDNHLNLVTELNDGTEDPLPKGLHPIPLSGITTTKKTALFYSRFDRQRKGNSTGLWARAFTYEEGAFRFIGYGSKPFWIWENDSAFTQRLAQKPIQLAKLIHQVPASYPASAMAKGIGGKVVLKLMIDAQGKVADTQILSGDPALTQAAIDAARQWRFEAPMRNGSPIESFYIAEFNFGKQ